MANAAVAGVQWQKSRDHAALFPLNLSQLKRSAVLLIVAALWVFLVPIVGYLVTATLATLAVVLFFEPKRDKAHVIRDVVVTLIFSCCHLSALRPAGGSTSQGPAAVKGEKRHV